MADGPKEIDRCCGIRFIVSDAVPEGAALILDEKGKILAGIYGLDESDQPKEWQDG